MFKSCKYGAVEPPPDTSEYSKLNIFEPKNQDGRQYLGMVIGGLQHLIRSFAGCMLIYMVPHVIHEDSLRGMTVTLNSMTFVVVLFLFFIEVKRELMLIEYLDENPERKQGNKNVEKYLEAGLDPKILQDIQSICRIFKWYFYVACAFIIVNTILSGCVIFTRADAQTAAVFTTNLVFLITKIVQTRQIVIQPPFVFFSSFILRKTQYNDVDPDYKVTNQ